jgi:hypothetical protein
MGREAGRDARRRRRGHKGAGAGVPRLSSCRLGRPTRLSALGCASPSLLVRDAVKKARRSMGAPSAGGGLAGGGGRRGGGSMVAAPRPTRYSDLGGIEEVLADIRETIEYPLKHPEVGVRRRWRGQGGSISAGGAVWGLCCLLGKPERGSEEPEGPPMP